MTAVWLFLVDKSDKIMAVVSFKVNQFYISDKENNVIFCETLLKYISCYIKIVQFIKYISTCSDVLKIFNRIQFKKIFNFDFPN